MCGICYSTCPAKAIDIIYYDFDSLVRYLEGAKQGSKNHQLILNLMEKGAAIRKTEDPTLLKEEYKYITTLAQSKSIAGKTLAYLRYKIHKDRLTKERDKFVANIIDKTLKERETGVLFMGSLSRYNCLPSRRHRDGAGQEARKN